MDIVWAILSAIVTGLIIGALARLIVPGTKGVSIVMTILLGIAGAIVGSLVVRAVRREGHVGRRLDPPRRRGRRRCDLRVDLPAVSAEVLRLIGWEGRRCTPSHQHEWAPASGGPFVFLAVAVGFEPTVRLPPHTLSRRAPLAARTRHRGRDYSPAPVPSPSGVGLHPEGRGQGHHRQQDRDEQRERPAQ